MTEVVVQRRTEVEISRIGLVCTVGRNAAQAALLLRAGHTELRPTPFSDGHHVPRMSQLWDLPEQCVGFERLLGLAVPALHQVVAAKPQTAALGAPPAGRGPEPPTPEDQPIPLLLALPPEGRADDDEDAAARFAAVLSEAAGLRIDGDHSLTLRGGHASGVRLLARAMDLLEQGQAEQVLVGGVDGYYHPELLDALDRADQLFGSATSGGFLPGEAAAFVLLQRPEPRPTSPTSDDSGGGETDEQPPRPRLCWAAAERIPDEVLAALLEEDAEDEEDEEDEPSQVEQPSRASSNSAAARAARRAQARLRRALTRLTGGGGRARSWWRRRRARQTQARKDAEREALPDVTATMAELVKGARAAQSEGALEWVLTDLNHEPERTDQWSTVMIEEVPAEARCDHPMQQLGDAGAATAPVLVALACANWQLGCAPARSVLIATHSNDADRGVVLLREPS